MNYSYDAQGYASAITVNPVSTNGVGVNTGSTPGIPSAITYNADNNLKGRTWQDGSAKVYSFDANGNRLTKLVGGTTYTNTISATINRVTQIGDVGGPFMVSYDSSGNITGDGTNTYTYSDRGRMASATKAGGTVNRTGIGSTDLERDDTGRVILRNRGTARRHCMHCQVLTSGEQAPSVMGSFAQVMGIAAGKIEAETHSFRRGSHQKVTA